MCKGKLNGTLNLIRITPQIPEKYFKHLERTQGLYEIRVEVGSNIYRIFAFFDKGNLVVLGNGFQKNLKRHRNKRLREHLREEYKNEK